VPKGFNTHHSKEVSSLVRLYPHLDASVQKRFRGMTTCAFAAPNWVELQIIIIMWSGMFVGQLGAQHPTKGCWFRISSDEKHPSPKKSMLLAKKARSGGSPARSYTRRASSRSTSTSARRSARHGPRSWATDDIVDSAQLCFFLNLGCCLTLKPHYKESQIREIHCFGTKRSGRADTLEGQISRGIAS
jgi:hypothetical protein